MPTSSTTAQTPKGVTGHRGGEGHLVRSAGLCSLGKEVCGSGQPSDQPRCQWCASKQAFPFHTPSCLVWGICGYVSLHVRLLSALVKGG